MAKIQGRFKHVNKGQIIENGREVEFKIEMKSGDVVTIQMLVSQIPELVVYLQNLAIKASD